ncbi:unnamed protein product [Microthlaspi erraticum]|uniref:FBD domain-containing protein n=1 Tax=Microthlaspi erraticum TaxID=1685480 RepID=A0A6D2KU61_9BRAS|nr:unnamed protein product [Microthlaspi erraticum]
MVCLPCLKTLQLRNVTYLNEDSLQRLLSNCPVLEDLLVDEGEVDNLRKVIVMVSSLQRLALCIPHDLDELVINTPSLKYFKIQYHSWKSHHKCLIEKMPKLREAFLDVYFPSMDRLIRSITSAKLLTFISLEDDVYIGEGFVFNQLQNLKLFLCKSNVSSLLVQLLKDSPKLRSLDLFVMEDHENSGIDGWNQPSTVPECLLSSLQTFKFLEYVGRPREREIATYILQNARRLKTATIMSQPGLYETLDMIKELALSPRASTACKLVFV